jgi:integrase
VLLHTGARRDEILTLRWENVDLPEKTITLFDTKNRTTLTIPVCEYVVELLQARRDARPSAEFVFPSRGKTGRMIDLKAPLQSISAMGGKKISTHDLRRTFLTICEELDIGVMTRKRLVNHSIGSDVTAGYTQISMSKMRRAVESIADYIANSQQIVSKNMQQTAQQ